MNSSLFAGLAVGTALVVAGIIGANVIYPPARDLPVQEESFTQAPPETEDEAPQPPIEEEPSAQAEAPDSATPEDTPEQDVLPEIAPSDTAAQDEPAMDDTSDQSPETAPSPDPEIASEDTDALEPDPEVSMTDAPVLHSPQVDAQPPAFADAMPDESTPDLPALQDEGSIAALPMRIAQAPQADAGLESGALAPPAPLRPVDETPEPTTLPDTADLQQEQVTQEPRQTLPGTRVSGLPRIGEASEAATTVDQGALPDVTPRPALLRNSVYQGGTDIGDKMAIVLSDPGLPMPIRRDLAALDFPFTVALNPMDSTAPQAAELFHTAGKEVLILASGLPAGATASDLDVSLNAYFTSLPLAVGVIDLPENGFARNAGLLREVLPLLAQDGHGLLTFAGGLTQAGRAADAAGVAHTEVFRVLDAGNESVFTIRRYLDRAVFQASQIGHVIVFGDASNEETLETIQNWHAERRSAQIALVPVSGILLQND